MMTSHALNLYDTLSSTLSIDSAKAIMNYFDQITKDIMAEQIETSIQHCATKEDLIRVEHSMDRFSTKEDLLRVEHSLDRFATKEDLLRVETSLDRFATKEDLLRVESSLDRFATKEDLLRVEIKLERQMAEMKAELMKWMFIFIMGQTALLVGLIKFIL